MLEVVAAVAPAAVKRAVIEEGMGGGDGGAYKVSPSVPAKGELIRLLLVLELGLAFVDKSESSTGTF
jgi:hypothetical protein